MLRMKLWAPLVLFLSAAALGVSAPADLAVSNPSSNGCNGNIVAFFNHNSGTTANNSKGPGFFLGGDSPGSVPAAIQGARSLCP